jgi:hypothetical protein
VSFLIHEGRRDVTAIHDATNDIMHNIFNTLFSLCHSTLDKVGETQYLNNAIENNDNAYYARR